MKRTIRYFVFLILVSIMICLPFGNSIYAYEVTPIYYASLTHNGEVTEYEKIQEAIDAAQDGDTVKQLLQTSEDINISKNITFDFNRQNANFLITVENNSNVTFLNGPNRAVSKEFDIKDGCTVTFNGGKYTGLSQTSSTPKITLGSNCTLIFDGGVEFEGNSAVLAQGSNSTITIKEGKVTGRKRCYCITGRK